jgi:ABC-type antimicrobial peptide transport system permease subunit
LNNTKTRTTLAIVAILMAATLVVGLTVAATITPSAFAGGSKKDRQDKNIKGGEQDGYKKDRKANGEKDNGSNNGNTNTVQILKQKAKASGKFSIVQQNGQNVICTHPSSSSPDSTDLIGIGSNPPAGCTNQSSAPPAQP